MLSNIGLPGFLIVTVFPVICFWKIFKKSGFSSYWGLFALVPVGAIVLLGVLAFANWPANHEVSE